MIISGRNLLRMSHPKYKIAGMMAICDFPIAPLMAIKLSHNVDYLILRYDTKQGHKRDGIGGKYHYDLLTTLNPFNIPVDHFISDKGGGNSVCFLEELIERVDKYKPDFVFQCDSDEMYPFCNSFWREFDKFAESDCDYMQFDWRMITRDNRKVPLAPTSKHTKIYRWCEGIKFNGGGGFGKPKFPFARKPKIYNAKNMMEHWWTYTPELQKIKTDYYHSGGKFGGLEMMFWNGDCYDEWKEKYGYTIGVNRWIENQERFKNKIPEIIRRENVKK